MSPPSSPEALYHAIPQALADENHAIATSDIELDGEEEQEHTGLALDPPQALVGPRISLMYFLLGCSVLLPWNGTYPLGRRSY